MEIIAVIIGYILGIAPFVVPKIVEMIRARQITEIDQEEEKKREEIFDEWLNGAKETNEPNQKDLFEEYMTGKPTKGE